MVTAQMTAIRVVRHIPSVVFMLLANYPYNLTYGLQQNSGNNGWLAYQKRLLQYIACSAFENFMLAKHTP
jgi:hypothetical protein